MNDKNKCSETMLFCSEDFGQIRTIEENGKIYFCGADVAKALGYKDTKKAIARHCREKGVINRYIIDSMGRTQEAKFIDEGNL